VSARRPTKESATDWDRYYSAVPTTARLTRRYTTAALIKAIRRFASAGAESGLKIVELGGANSCFLDALLGAVQCAQYEIVDTNRYGLSLLQDKVRASRIRIVLRNEDVLSLRAGPNPDADVVFSVGLIEHFDREGTHRAVQAHFDLLRTGGIAIITFPTPTFLYTASRRCIEALGRWQFHDERPLRFAEVYGAAKEQGCLLYSKILWPLFLTQGLVVVRKLSR